MREAQALDESGGLTTNLSDIFHDSPSDRSLHAAANGYDSTGAHTGTVHVSRDPAEQYRYLQKRARILVAYLH